LALRHEAIDRQRHREQVESAFDAAVRRARLGAVMSATAVLFILGAVGVVF
jgi:hypothetical protein